MSDPTVRQRLVARTLRQWRADAGMVLDDVTSRLGWSRSKLSRLERAETIPGPAEVIVLATIYDIPTPERDEYAALASHHRRDDWARAYPEDTITGELQDFIELESEASKLENFEAVLIPGLLQTAEYAAAVAAGWDCGVPDDDIAVAHRTEVRVRRQARLHSDKPLLLHAVVHELALRSVIGGSQVMRRQLHHLAASAERPNITLQVLPASAGAHPSFGSTFAILHHGEHTTPTVFLDTLIRGIFIQEPEDVERCKITFERLRDFALNSTESVRLIRAVAAEITTDEVGGARW
ncbi:MULTISPECIES: helix-turn-helix domain-containing protein [Actinoalloteichus]|uniref:helix-turn-helix domain-containing protein n=1 Tax=Actinoalloteichus TaxID=65496 RepID=UPI0026ACBDBE